jgi:biotin operon repressor
MKKKYITATEFEEKFESGEDLTSYLDIDQALRPGLEQKRVSVDFPLWMVQKLDKVAKRLGVTRQSVIKVFISEKLKEESL